MKDFSIYESGNGGDLLLINDLNLADEILQIVYISLFGGNTEATTLGNEKPGEFRNDWWGNALIFDNEPKKQFNSLTEKTLKTTPLSSFGRIAILNAVKEDLSVLKRVVDVSAEVYIKDSNRVEILVKISKYKNKQDVDLQILWDNIKESVVINKRL